MNIWRVIPTTLDQGKVRLGLHSGQRRAWSSTARFPFIISGSQAGKTCFGPWWLDREIQARGAGDYLAVTASYDLFKLKMLPELRQVFEEVLRSGRYWAGERIIELRDPLTEKFMAQKSSDPMWGRIILRSAQSSGGLESATANAAWADEIGQDGVTLEDWQAIQRRLALNQGRCLGTTTPYNMGWLKSEVYDRWVEGDSTFDVIQYASVLNPAFPQAEFDRLESTMQDWRFGMFYRGEFTRPAGLIYSAFTDQMLEDPFPIPEDWARHLGVDFGGANNAVVFLARDPDTMIWHLYDEQLVGDLTTREQVAGVLEKLAEVDDWRASGGGPSEEQERRDWGAAGLRVRKPRIGGVEPGIDRVTEMIKKGLLRVFRTCKGVRDEIGSYRRKLDALGQPMEVILHKREYHRLDGLRYMAVNSGGHVPFR